MSIKPASAFSTAEAHDKNQDGINLRAFQDYTPLRPSRLQDSHAPRGLYLRLCADTNHLTGFKTLLTYFAAPHTSPYHFCRSVVWTFFQLLYFCIANQVFDPDEDALNKPWRPIPAGRISVRHANILRATILPVCIALSWCWNVLPQCIILVVLGSVYNDFNLGAHWAPRHTSVAVMYAALNAGAAHVACDGRSSPLGRYP